MLTHLEIQNYALIEHLDIDFNAGFSVLTGETGAGKSIIMGALALVLGQRADAKAIQDGKKKCVIEARFAVENYGLENFFQENDLDFSPEILIRREVADTGKSRAFVNDTPVSIAVLKELSEQLIDIHSQHQNLLLARDKFQLGVVDSVADVKKIKPQYEISYLEYKNSEKELKILRENAQTWREEYDYTKFQYEQLKNAKLVAGEQEDLERELELLNHSQEVKSAISSALDSLENEQVGVLRQLKSAENSFGKIVDFLPILSELQSRIESARIDLQDVSAELERVQNDVEFNPDRKEELEARLDLIYDLQQKHRKESVAELLVLQAELEAKLEKIDSFDEQISALQTRFDRAFAQVSELANSLTEKRKSVVKEICQAMEEKLHLLGMPNARFEVVVEQKEDFSPTGKDAVQFMFSANKNAVLQRLTEVASGGEMARVMLAIKSLLVVKSFLPTIVFDEIDTGVSGEIAHCMGLIMAQIAEKMQVLTITHLPQIASKGTTHYKVFKQDTAEKTVTNIVLLEKEKRVVEIAELLSGKNPSQAALDNAREMLNF